VWRSSFVVVALAVSVGPALAVEPGSEIIPPRLEIAPAIDGHLDDPAWDGAARVEGFTQVEPFHGEPSPVATTVLLGYDDEALYVAIDCQDDDMSRVAASVTTRDGVAGRDDDVAVMLDTFHDGDSAYYFATNVLGTQFDGTVANNGRTIDDQWDAAWTNASASGDHRGRASIAGQSGNRLAISGSGKSVICRTARLSRAKVWTSVLPSRVESKVTSNSQALGG
jgi:hypothetical protein